MSGLVTEGPVSIRVKANGLEHHVLEWPGASSRTVFLIHGYMDAAGTWDRVAPALVASGHRVLAADMRGFGEGARAPSGSYYHFADYVADVAELTAVIVPEEPFALVGHSMGGTIATLFAGAFPERVSRLANLEGLGPPDYPFDAGPIRMRSWIEQVRALRAKDRLRTMTREEARERLAGNHPGVPADVLDHRLPHLVREEGGGVVWRVDPLHRTTSPLPFFARLWIEFAKRVTCPVMFVDGGEAGFHPPDENERLAAFGDLRRETIADAGHMMHWTRPEKVGALLRSFLT
jgi:pimeloyl-ACP methyl ester carboxylesterase